jgi:hypothetical protein
MKNKTFFQLETRLPVDHSRKRVGGGHRQVGGFRGQDGAHRLDRDAMPENVQQGVPESGKSYSGKFGRCAG